MFARWGRLMYRRRALVLGIGVASMALAGLFGAGALARLQSAGGFTAPASQSAVAASLAQRAFGRDVPDVVVLYSSRSMTVADPAYRAAVTKALSRLPRRYVASAESYFSTGQSRFVSPDRQQTYAVIGLAGGSDTARVASWNAISGRLAARGLAERAGGQIPFEQAANSAVKSDITRAGALSLPVVLILLAFIFGSLAAASLPLIAGGIGILGSLTVLRLKAIVMNILSLSAMYGIVVWIFQDGHLSGPLGFTPTGTIDPAMPILLLAIMFGLSTDYEVFLLSRVREQYDLSHDNAAAVAAGLQRTGGIITSAAFLLLVVIAAFSASGIAFIKLLGVGMITALVIDASLVRVLLVPAIMRLLGTANWWAPRPLRRFYARYGIRDSAAPRTATRRPARSAETATISNPDRGTRPAHEGTRTGS